VKGKMRNEYEEGRVSELEKMIIWRREEESNVVGRWVMESDVSIEWMIDV